MGYGVDLFPLKSPVTIIKFTPKRFAAIEEILDLAARGIKELAKPGCVGYVQLKASSYGLYLRERKTSLLVFCADNEGMLHPAKVPEFFC